MKTKSFLLGAAAILLATACSNDEVVKVAENGAPIGFSSFINKSTRAKDNTNETLKDLAVYGVYYKDGSEAETVAPFAVFNNIKVTKGDPLWSYEDPRYWIVGNTYTFAAVAPYNAAGVTVNNGTLAKANGGIQDIKFNNNGEVDLLFDKKDNIVAVATMEPVAFNLKHILSKVIFVFNNGLSNNYKIEVSEVTITSAKTDATFNPSDEKWDVVADKSAPFGFTITEGHETAVGGMAVTTESTYLLPTEFEEADKQEVEYEATFKITLSEKDAKTEEFVPVKGFENLEYTVDLPGNVYKKGYSYAFSTTITQDNINPDPNQPLKPIEFKAEASVWVDDDDAELSVTTKNPSTPTTSEVGE